jgi:hypothetical protein
VSNNPEVLTDIAEALDLMATAPNYPWIAPIAILISGGIGWWASQYTIRRREAQIITENEEKEKLVFHLLHDEIKLRWYGDEKIQTYLRELLNNDPLYAFLTFSTMELSRDDLFVFKSVSTSFAEFYFIKDRNLISEIINGYLLFGDLIDFKSKVSLLLEKRKSAYSQLRDALPEEEVKQRIDKMIGKNINNLWNEFPKKLDAIDDTFNKILPQICQ